MLATNKFTTVLKSKVGKVKHYYFFISSYWGTTRWIWNLLRKTPVTVSERNETYLSVVTPIFWWYGLSEEWRQGDRWTSPRSHGYVPGKVGLLCPREGRGICCIANWWSLVNCRVGRKLELTNQTGLFQRSWQLQYTANQTFANITYGVISP